MREKDDSVRSALEVTEEEQTRTSISESSRNYPRLISVSLSPSCSRTRGMIPLPSSTGPGERVVQMARRAYIRSHILLTWKIESSEKKDERVSVEENVNVRRVRKKEDDSPVRTGSSGCGTAASC